MSDTVVSVGKGKVGKIYVCQPQYSGGIPASHKQFWRGAGNKYLDRLHVEGGGSLLANVFNRFWIHAINLQDNGENITHFAMLHDDIVPQDGWLDILIDELLQSDADLMSAVVPIKDWMGLTSTAIKGVDPYTVTRRITMTEVYNLPETFSAEDCGYPHGTLLANTGCWVCDLTKPWVRATDEQGNLKCYFTISDRIRKTTTKEGSVEYISEVASEDWNFSRMVQENGGKVMCTRKVQVLHYGHIPFNNAEPWGTCPMDSLLNHRHGGKVISKEGYEYHKQNVEVDGWLTFAEGQFLAKCARGKKVLEVGSYCGKSTIWMARTAEKVYAVDPHDGRGTPHMKNTLQEFKDNLDKYGVADKVVTVPSTLQEATDLPEEFDFAFIDGAHNWDNVKSDTWETFKRMKEGGLVAFHDYDLSQPDVMKWINLLLKFGYEKVEQVGSILVIKRECKPTTNTANTVTVTDNVAITHTHPDTL